MIVVDTSVLISFLRGDNTPQTRFLTQIELASEPYGIPLFCVQELLQGAKDKSEWRKLKSYLLSQTLVEPIDYLKSHISAAQIFFDCRRKGLTIRSAVDCFIAQIALDHSAALLHSDKDYEKISRVRPLVFPELL